MKKNNRWKIGECVYCGKFRDDLTKDHVVPLCLFTQPYPNNLITVPVCPDCNNNKKSKDDDYLRDFLTVDIFGNQNPIANNIFRSKVKRSIQRNSSVLFRNFTEKLHDEPYYTSGGVYLGKLPSIPIDLEKINTIFSTMVKGLFFHHNKLRIPGNYITKVMSHEPWHFDDLWNCLNAKRPRLFGEVFGYGYTSLVEDQFTTIWLMWFYNRVLFSVHVYDPKIFGPSVN